MQNTQGHESTYNIEVSGDEYEVLLLALVTLLKEDDTTHDIFEPGFKPLTESLLVRMRQEAEKWGLFGEGAR